MMFVFENNSFQGHPQTAVLKEIDLILQQRIIFNVTNENLGLFIVI